MQQTFDCIDCIIDRIHFRFMLLDNFWSAVYGRETVLSDVVRVAKPQILTDLAKHISDFTLNSLPRWDLSFLNGRE